VNMTDKSSRRLHRTHGDHSKLKRQMSHLIEDIESPGAPVPYHKNDDIDEKVASSHDNAETPASTESPDLEPYEKVDEFEVRRALQNLSMFQTDVDGVDNEVAQIERDQRLRYDVHSFYEKKES
jgi:hypothetical protein